MASVAPAPTPAYSTTLTLPSEAAPAPRNLSEKTQKGKKNTFGIPRGVTLICCLLYVVYVLDCTRFGWNNQVFESEKQYVARFSAILLITSNTGCVDNATIVKNAMMVVVMVMVMVIVMV